MTQEKKFHLGEGNTELLSEYGITVYRIIADKDFDDVKKGDVGGYIQHEGNLSHRGNCWVYPEAIVIDDAKLVNNAKIYNNVLVEDKAFLGGNVKCFGDAWISGHARIDGDVRIHDKSHVYEHAHVYGHASIYNNSKVHGEAQIYDEATIHDFCDIYGTSNVYGNIGVHGHAEIKDADVCKMGDYIVFQNWWSSGRYFTWTRSNDMWKVGCFHGSADILIDRALNGDDEDGDHCGSELRQREYKRVVKYVESVKNSFV